MMWLPQVDTSPCLLLRRLYMLLCCSVNVALSCPSLFICAQLTVLLVAVKLKNRSVKLKNRSIHFIKYISGFLSRGFVVGEKKVTICRSPKSGANFFALGNFDEQVSAAYARAQPAIAAAKAHRETAPVASLMPLFAWMGGPQ